MRRQLVRPPNELGLLSLEALALLPCITDKARRDEKRGKHADKKYPLR